MVQEYININGYRLKNSIYLTIIIGGYIAFFLLNSINSDKSITACPFKIITGIPCPGCGMGRATLKLVHFDFYESFLYNPLAIPFSFAVALSVLWLVRDIFKGSNSFLKVVKTKTNKWLMWSIFIVIIAVWMRNVFMGI